MPSKEEFFRLAVIALKLHRETATQRAIDRFSLEGYGLDKSQCDAFLTAIKPIAQSREFELYLEGTFLELLQYLLSMFDGACGFAADSPHQYQIVDETGKSIGDDLHFDFGGYLLTNGLVHRPKKR